MSRAGVGALGAGAARNALEKTLAFVKGQKFLEKPLINQEWVQVLIAEMQKNESYASIVTIVIETCE